MTSTKLNSSLSCQGSAMATTLILMAALLVVVAGYFSAVIQDKRLAFRNALLAEARNAAEGAVEVAVAEANRRASSYSSFTATALSSFTMPTSMQSYLANGNVSSASIGFKIGSLSAFPSQPILVDKKDPFNRSDTQGSFIIRHSYVYGKASAVNPLTGQALTSYVSTLLQIREQTWLNYAVFYNMDMEMHSGGDMLIKGPVHTNKNAYLTAGTKLEFYDSFTTAKKVYRKYKYGGTSVSHTGPVSFTPIDNPSTSDLLTMATTEDSTKSGWYNFANSRWKGFVQDNDPLFGVSEFNPPGMQKYVEDDPSTSATNEMRNNAYSMLEPQLASVTTDVAPTATTLGTYGGYKGDDVEDQKFSALAGLIIKVNNSNSFDLYYYSGADSTRPVNRDNLPARDATTKRPTEILINKSPAKMSPALLTKLNNAIKMIPYAQDSGANGNGPLTKTTVGSTDYYGIYDRRQGYQGTSTNNGLKGAMHALHVDMAALHTFLNAPASEFVDQSDATKKVYNPNSTYSGVIYIQLPVATDPARADKVRPAVAPTTTTAGYAVVLENANSLPRLPSDTSKRDDGLTVAVNGPVYVHGSYNSDGNSGTGSSSTADTSTPDAVTGEVPALIAADSVTLLSSSFSFRNSATATNNASTFTEFSSGVIAGVVPTKVDGSGNGVDNQWAGGVHNFVRFLEDWGGKTYRYRGSIVSLFESEVAKAPWYQSVYTYWYGLPTRDLGYHPYFAAGKFPPGLPVLRTVRRISVADITAATYNAAVPTPPAAGL